VKYLALIAIAGLAVAPGVGAQQRSTDNSFRWTGRIANGHWLSVRNLNGAVRVERSTSGEVEVTAEKSWRRGNPDDVRIEVSHAGSGDQDVLICAIWNENTTCDEDGYHSHGSRNDRNNDVAVAFTVRIPSDVRLDASTVNGALDITGAGSEVEAHTVNGRITATSTGGPVRASTTNGDIDVRMGDTGDRDLNFRTVNGSITVTVPEGINADVDMRTVNGSVNSDFPMTISGRINPRRIRATIGRGGRNLSFSTVNGSLELRRP
jgi:hypothetical protein